MSGLGEAAALGASVLWTFTSIAFTIASRRIGPFAVNMWRMLFATGLLTISHIALLGWALPAANGSQWLYLGLSGTIGLAIGDLPRGGWRELGPEEIALCLEGEGERA